MAGLVAVLSDDPEVRARGEAALRLLRHTLTFQSCRYSGERLWVGATGFECDLSVAVSGHGSDSRGTDGHGADDQNLVAVVAGEVLNKAAVAHRLGLRDATPARVVLRAYERWGAAALDRFEGRFAVVIHDAATGRTLVGHDPFGTMFVHVLTLGDDVLIATEAKAFLADPRFKPELDAHALALIAILGHEFGRGLFRDVRALDQGCRFEIADGSVREVRQWDPAASYGDLRGDAYLDRLEGAIHELAGEVFVGSRLLLPLTGGLDSRLLAAAIPPSQRPAVTAMTFGADGDVDVEYARGIARALKIDHMTIPFEPDYVARHAAQTVWLADGRLTPLENITGSQMDRFAEYEAFVSGICGGPGRRYFKGRGPFPDYGLLRRLPDDEAHRVLRVFESGLSHDETNLLFGDRAQAVTNEGRDELHRVFAPTRELTGADRIDFGFIRGRVRSWRTSGLNLASIWLPARAPFLGRRWVDAILSGAPSERLDDVVRLRLVRRLDPRVARVPWTLTRLPLRESELILRALRQAARLRPETSGRSRAGISATGPAEGGRRSPGRALSDFASGRLRRAVSSYADDRMGWLRTVSRDYVEDVLLAPRAVERGLFDPAGVRRLVDEHMAGANHGEALAFLLTIELWHRLFQERRAAAREDDRVIAA